MIEDAILLRLLTPLPQAPRHQMLPREIIRMLLPLHQRVTTGRPTQLPDIPTMRAPKLL